jgi:hypothetical protein
MLIIRRTSFVYSFIPHVNCNSILDTITYSWLKDKHKMKLTMLNKMLLLSEGCLAGFSASWKNES